MLSVHPNLGHRVPGCQLARAVGDSEAVESLTAKGARAGKEENRLTPKIAKTAKDLQTLTRHDVGRSQG